MLSRKRSGEGVLFVRCPESSPMAETEIGDCRGDRFEWAIDGGVFASGGVRQQFSDWRRCTSGAVRDAPMNEKFLSWAHFLQNPGAGYLYGSRAIENAPVAQAGPKQTSDSSATKMPIREGGVFDGLEVWLRLGRDDDADV
jgi:hypothetical protein